MIDLEALHPLLVIIHLLGVAVGAGAGFMVDVLFFSSLRTRQITAEKVKTIALGSRLVWLGIFLILVSGLLLVLSGPGILRSPKFLAKMTIVGILIANGTVFHFVHYPALLKNYKNFFSSSQEFLNASRGLFISGAISAPSWIAALTLGVLSRLPYSYWFYMGIYAAVIAGGILSSLILRGYLASKLPSSQPAKLKSAVLNGAR
ncbi:MAG: hypothetical protein WEC39_02270 [Patescibacteria group bacterium]